jgi:hypothetical protein
MPAGRPKGRTSFNSPLSDTHRAKIANSSILNCLLEHIEGRRDMSATQVSAALGLLRKVLPDLQASENKTEVTVQSVMRMPTPSGTVDEWVETYAKPHRLPTH